MLNSWLYGLYLVFMSLVCYFNNIVIESHNQDKCSIMQNFKFLLFFKFFFLDI